MKQSVTNYKILDMDFYLIMCLCNVCETLGYKIFEVKDIKGSFSEWNIVLIFMFHNIKYAAFEIFHKVHKGIKNVDFLDFFKKGRPFKWFLTWWPQKQIGNLEFLEWKLHGQF